MAKQWDVNSCSCMGCLKRAIAKPGAKERVIKHTKQSQSCYNAGTRFPCTNMQP
jgi:hypothetical protein